MEKILVVDDSRTARHFIRRSLEGLGFSDTAFIEAGNGKEALALLKQDPVNLVIADLNMPLMDGEGLLKWMKSSPKLKKIPVIFITSAKTDAKADYLSSLGAEAILGKPVAPHTLSQAISKLNN